MFKQLKERFGIGEKTKKEIALQPPGEVFPWIKSTRLTAMEDLMLAVPYAILEEDEAIGSIICSDSDDLVIGFPENKENGMLYLTLKSGMTVWLTKSSQAVVVSDDDTPKRIMVTT
jgi:hypothetical protein